MEVCKEVGVTSLAYYPLAMGLLASKLRPGGASCRARDLRAYWSQIGPLSFVLEAIAAETGKTPAQIALNWVVWKGAVPIVGVTRASQIEANVGEIGRR